MIAMAIGTLKPLSQEQRQRYLPNEVQATLQLYPFTSANPIDQSLEAEVTRVWRKLNHVSMGTRRFRVALLENHHRDRSSQHHPRTRAAENACPLSRLVVE
jgi:hypothetical protein